MQQIKTRRNKGQPPENTCRKGPDAIKSNHPNTHAEKRD